jgi:lipopolysaccharide export system permease protein
MNATAAEVPHINSPVITLPQTRPAGAIANVKIHKKCPLGIERNCRFYYLGLDGFYSFVRPDIHKDEFLYFPYASFDVDY